MKKAIEEDATPNIFAMEYDPDQWTITNLFLIPRFAYGLSAIKCRAPLSATAERHDWIGCTILLDRIPQQARIPIIVSGVSIPREIVRAQYRKVRPLSQLRPDMRGWTLDVYNCIQRFGKQAFTTKEVRELVPELQKLHPGNYHVEEKIRQQLQKLRDLHLVDFPARGQYRIR